MGGRPRVHKQSRNRNLIRGTKKHFAGTPAIHLSGRAIAPAEIVRLLESQIALLSEIQALEAARHDAIVRERALEKRLAPVLRGLRDHLDGVFGNKAQPLADFGYEPRRKPGPKTPAVKVEAARKALATRALRRTMGKRQKKKIKAAG
jgi:hypothetical protein